MSYTKNVNSVGALTEIIQDLREIDVPVIIFGPPGIGKSQSIQAAVNKEENERFIDIRLSQCDPTDVAGVPHIEDVFKNANNKLQFLVSKLEAEMHLSTEAESRETREKIAKLLALMEGYENTGTTSEVRYARPDIWPEDGAGIICLEEINTAAPAVQNTMLQPLGSRPGKDRIVGTHKVPSSYYWCATGNRRKDGAHVTQLSSAVRGRCAMINIEGVNVKEWTEWAFDNDVHDYVISFIQYAGGEYLYRDPTDFESTSNFPSPRTWSRMVSEFCKHDMLSYSLVATAVGSGPASEFMTFVEELQGMPDVNKILNGQQTFNPKNYEPTVIYAVVTSAFTKVRETPSRLTNAMTNIVDKVKPEYASVFITNALRDENVRKRAMTNKGLRKWASNHSSLIERYDDFDE